MAVIPHRRAGRIAPGSSPAAATILGGPPHDVALAGRTRRTDQPPSPEVRLALDASVARIERRANDLLAEAEANLVPAQASGFADRFAKSFDDLAAHDLLDMPAPLRPALAEGHAAVRDAITAKARRYEALAGRIETFNIAHGLLTDLAAGVRHDPAAFEDIRKRGLASIGDLPVGGPARKLLTEAFLADLPLRLAEARIDDDPDGAARAFGPVVASEYQRLNEAQIVRLGARARTEAARRRSETARAEVERLERAIDANRIGMVDLAAAPIEPRDRQHLVARLEARQQEAQWTATVLEEFEQGSAEYDRESPGDREKVEAIFAGLGGTLEALAAGDEATIRLLMEVTGRTGIVPDSVLGEIARLEEEGEDEQRDLAIRLIAQLAPFLSRDDGHEGNSRRATSGRDPVAAGAAPDNADDPAAPRGPIVAGTSGPEDDTDWWPSAAVTALDILTDVIPVVSEVKALGQLAYLGWRLGEAVRRGDRRKAGEISFQMSLAASGLLPGPNVAGIALRAKKLVGTLNPSIAATRAAEESRDTVIAAMRAAEKSRKTERARARSKRKPRAKMSPEAQAASRERVRENASRGRLLEQRGLARLRKLFPEVQPQITVVTASGYRIRLDAAIRRRDGTIEFVEFKSADAVLSKNQRLGFADFRKNGGYIAGKGKEGIEGMTVFKTGRIREIKMKREVNEVRNIKGEQDYYGVARTRYD